MEQPLFATEAEALAADGEIYKHYKGGVYRLMQRGVKDCETLEDGVIYEHLWPHGHHFWYRSEKDFFSQLPTGEPRFKLVKSQ
jgi:hypothetical protein